MRVGGKTSQGKIAECNPIIVISDDDDIKTCPVIVIEASRRFKRLLGVKRKNYVEKTPEPRDYAGYSDWESYMSPDSWGAAMHDYNDEWPRWEEGA